MSCDNDPENSQEIDRVEVTSNARFSLGNAKDVGLSDFLRD